MPLNRFLALLGVSLQLDEGLLWLDARGVLKLARILLGFGGLEFRV